MLNYIEPVFRPPSEARSLILQVTNGCSWNNCTFCEMYTADQKKFSVKTSEEITQELQKIAASGISVRRVFLADGDATTLSFRRLKEILLLIRQYLPDVQRVSSYCLPRNLKNKTVEELTELEQLGLKLMYVGCESGDDLVLEKVSKGENYQSSLAALAKIKQSGIKSSVMILNGLGGQQYSEQHAVNSALLMNEAQPEFLSTLVVSFPVGVARFQQGFGSDFEPLQQMDLFREMEILLDALVLEKTVFRSDHASNYLVLKGMLSRDKDRLLTQVRTAIHNPDRIHLRQEWQRGL
ncbi:MAG: radical SAM protein [Porticoccus sp.]|nr:radical SAM protein [Porticoccus sp.]